MSQSSPFCLHSDPPPTPDGRCPFCGKVRDLSPQGADILQKWEYRRPPTVSLEDVRAVAVHLMDTLPALYTGPRVWVQASIADTFWAMVLMVKMASHSWAITPDDTSPGIPLEEAVARRWAEVSHSVAMKWVEGVMASVKSFQEVAWDVVQSYGLTPAGTLHPPLSLSQAAGETLARMLDESHPHDWPPFTPTGLAQLADYWGATLVEDGSHTHPTVWADAAPAVAFQSMLLLARETIAENEPDINWAGMETYLDEVVSTWTDLVLDEGHSLQVAAFLTLEEEMVKVPGTLHRLEPGPAAEAPGPPAFLSDLLGRAQALPVPSVDEEVKANTETQRAEPARTPQADGLSDSDRAILKGLEDQRTVWQTASLLLDSPLAARKLATALEVGWEPYSTDTVTIPAQGLMGQNQVNLLTVYHLRRQAPLGYLMAMAHQEKVSLTSLLVVTLGPPPEVAEGTH